MVLQDGPFLIVRLFIIYAHGVQTTTVWFFAAKNILVIFLELNRWVDSIFYFKLKKISSLFVIATYNQNETQQNDVIEDLTGNGIVITTSTEKRAQIVSYS